MSSKSAGTLCSSITGRLWSLTKEEHRLMRSSKRRVHSLINIVVMGALTKLNERNARRSMRRL
jgi:hypothetical protein